MYDKAEADTEAVTEPENTVHPNDGPAEEPIEEVKNECSHNRLLGLKVMLK